jgi:hypothetical protein
MGVRRIYKLLTGAAAGIALVGAMATSDRPASAAADQPNLGAAGPQGGTLAYAPALAWAKPLPEAVLSKMRGGYRGIAFSASFNAFVEPGTGMTATPDAVFKGAKGGVPSTISTPRGQVFLGASIGELGGGSTGIFQVSQAVGDNISINNNLFVQIDVFNIVDNGQAPDIRGLLDSTFR